MAEADEKAILARIAAEVPGGPAFPFVTGNVVAYGMSLRDYFAGQALTGWLATYGDSPLPEGPFATDMARRLYRIADAMIEARSRR